MADLAVTAALLLVEEFMLFVTHELHLKETVIQEVEAFKTRLAEIQAYVKDMEDKEGSEVLKNRVKQIRDVSYDIADVLDEFVLCVPDDQFRQHRLLKKVHKHAHSVWHRSSLHQIYSKIQRVKSRMDSIVAWGKVSASPNNSCTLMEEGSNSSSGHQVMRVLDDNEVVGYRETREELIYQLIYGENKRVSLSVVGSRGSGKTVLVKNVYDHKEVRRKFDCHAWIHVSGSFNNVEELFLKMLKQFCASRREAIPNEGVDAQATLMYYLQQKRYILVLDDISKREHWDCIKNALPSGSSSSRIIVTTRKPDVASYCVESTSCIHELIGLPHTEALDLFCKNAFRTGNGRCPPELEEYSDKFVKKCEGWPLALAEIGALLSEKQLIPTVWEKLHKSLGYEIIHGAEFPNISRTFKLSYKELPAHLKTCFLYFSIFPHRHSVRRGKLIRLWVAERFADLKARGKTLEDLAEDYLNELIGRHLVQGSRSDFDGRVKSCHVRSLVFEFIVQKSKDENFVLVLPEESSSFREKVRRLSIRDDSTTLSQCGAMGSVRSAFLSRLDNNFKEFKLLRVLDLQGAALTKFPAYIAHITLLRYLSLRDNPDIKEVPKSIKRLLYLETLDLKHTGVTVLPKQIARLHNLRHLLAYRKNLKNWLFDSVEGVRMFAGIRALTNLQRLSVAKLDKHGKIIDDLGKMTQLKKLGLVELKREDGTRLCTSLEKMQNLMNLTVCSTGKEEFLDLADMSSPPRHLQRLYLTGRLRKLPCRMDFVTSPSVQNWSKVVELADQPT